MRPRASPGPAGPVAGEGLIGQVIADRYRLLALVGEGGMGAVYKAEHVRMGKALALKLLRGDFAREPGAVERFRAEARIVSRLSHPHTIAVFDFGEIAPGEGFYLAMEYVPGQDLAAVLREARRLPEPRAIAIGQQVLGSLAEAHDAGVVHRDMKPANVMLLGTPGDEDFVKVLDFGIAKLRDEKGAATTHAEAIVGTPSYLAPEQARGDAVDGRADLYALGCLLYELVAGRPPFVAASPMAVVAAHLNQEPLPLGQVAPGVSRRFAEVVHRAMAKRADDRFPSADAMRRALLAAGERTGPSRREPAPVAAVTGELEIANRDDFRALDRVALRRAPRLLPLAALLVLAGLGAAAYRWQAIYGLAAVRFPALAAAVPAQLRPSDRYDGREHEPNDVPARANVLPLPAGPDGRAAGGVASVRGFVGAKLDGATGDVDLYRIDLPPGPPRAVLVAEWHGEGEPAQGIRGLDVALALNRARPGDPGGPAPLVATADRGGPGAPERLAAAIEGGTYWLAVRERHDEATGPVEKPSDAYVLTVRLADPEPGAELEPDDGPDRVEVAHEGYREWLAVAERNPLAAGQRLRGDTRPEDPDALAVVAVPGGAPAAVALVPDAGLALEVRRWAPDALDLGAPRAGDRVRFAPAGEGAPGEVLLVQLPEAPRVGAPVLLLVRGAKGAGGYAALALGAAAGSLDEARALFRALVDARRAPAALALAAAVARAVPPAPGRSALLVEAGRLAESVAASLADAALAEYGPASALLAAPIFEKDADGRAVYRGALEALARGEGPEADEAALRRVRLEPPCAPAEVAARAAAFLERSPAPAPPLLVAARTWRARALEEAFWAGGGADPALRASAVEAWRAVEGSEGIGALAALAASSRAVALAAQEPSRAGAGALCPLAVE
jgi:serine/threonine-protein kinase